VTFREFIPWLLLLFGLIFYLHHGAIGQATQMSTQAQQATSGIGQKVDSFESRLRSLENMQAQPKMIPPGN
jgi:hypothetical protein